MVSVILIRDRKAHQSVLCTFLHRIDDRLSGAEFKLCPAEARKVVLADRGWGEHQILEVPPAGSGNPGREIILHAGSP